MNIFKKFIAKIYIIFTFIPYLPFKQSVARQKFTKQSSLNINTKAQVVSSQTAMPIPNLYASGKNVSGVHEPFV